MYNSGSASSGDPVVVCLPEPPDCRDACLGQEVHGQVTQPLLSDHHIRLVLGDLCTDLFDVLFFHL